MENKTTEKTVIKAMDYIVPKLPTEQVTIELKDISGTEFEGIFFKPSTKQIMEMEDYSKMYATVDGAVYEKFSSSRKVEWILDNLLSIPAGLQVEHLDIESAKELAKTF